MNRFIDDFTVDVLNIIPIDPPIVEDGKIYYVPYLPEAINLSMDMTDITNTDIQIYNINYKKHNYLSPGYFSQLPLITDNAAYNKNGVVCGKYISSESDGTYAAILISKKEPTYNKLKCIFDRSSIFALPIYTDTVYALGTITMPKKSNYNHIVLCFGKVNGKYLII